MKPFDRNLMVFIKPESKTWQSVEQEVEKLHLVFHSLESPELFSSCHELVDRNFITNKKSRLRDVYHNMELKPFRFLICKN